MTGNTVCFCAMQHICVGAVCWGGFKKEWHHNVITALRHVSAHGESAADDSDSQHWQHSRRLAHPHYIELEFFFIQQTKQ